MYWLLSIFLRFPKEHIPYIYKALQSLQMIFTHHLWLPLILIGMLV